VGAVTICSRAWPIIAARLIANGGMAARAVESCAMKVFISWSGDRSKQLAQQLKSWLPKVIQSLDPWMSVEDIRAGGRWLFEVTRQLEESSFGIVCLTPENLREPWILFEAGALGKALETASVCPYLLGVEPSAISGPLAQFQAKRANKGETLTLLESMNANVAGDEMQHQLTDALLREAFEKWWPDLEAAIKAIPDRADAPARRNDRDMVEEILNLMRQIAQRTPLLFSRLIGFPPSGISFVGGALRSPDLWRRERDSDSAEIISR
jgi:hypothetical protein